MRFLRLLVAVALRKGAYIAHSLRYFCSVSIYQQESKSCEHDVNVFRMECCCTECMKYRETLVQLVLEEREFNTLWDHLKILIRECYDLIPE